MKAKHACYLLGGLHPSRMLALAIFTSVLFPSRAAAPEQASANKVPATISNNMGLDSSKLSALDADIAAGKYGLVDTMLILRCGQAAYERSYSHDYETIYGGHAKKSGPMNHDPSGEYNYFSTEFHPYYRHSDLHTMQSISKTVTSVTIGVAMQRKEFPVDLDTPILKFFDGYKIANLDDRKKSISLRHLLTMTSGLEWNEDLAYDDPANSSDVMEGKQE